VVPQHSVSACVSPNAHLLDLLTRLPTTASRQVPGSRAEMEETEAGVVERHHYARDFTQGRRCRCV